MSILRNVINKIKENELNIKELIKNKNQFSQNDWDFIAETYQDIPEIVLNSFIIKKENLGKEIGINYYIIYEFNPVSQEFRDKFNDQTYVKELEEMIENNNEEYDQLMGEYESQLVKYLDNIKQDSSKINDLINDKNLFKQTSWDYIVEKYENIPEIVANTFIIRKENLGKEIGIDFMKILYEHDYPEEFYDQHYIKEILDMNNKEYEKIMGSTPTLYDNHWYRLFYSKQRFFSKDFIIKNAEHFISCDCGLQKWQNVPLEFYEKYIDDKRLSYINIIYQDIPIDFIKKHIKKYYKTKINLSDFIEQKGLTEELFIEFLSYPEFNNKKIQNILWLTVGAYKISEEFIRKNLKKINKNYKDIFITNGYKSPWDLIVQNGVDYSESLINEHIKYINLKLVFDPWSILNCEKKQYSRQFIEKYWKYPDVDIKHIMSQKCIQEMDDFIEKLIDEKKIEPDILSSFEKISLKIVEKYHQSLDLEDLCYYNCNVTLKFFQDYILKWDPNIKLNIAAYLCIEKASEDTMNYFINSLYKIYEDEEIKLFYRFANDIINEFPDKYSNDLKLIMYNNKLLSFNLKNDMSKLASFYDDDIIYKHSLLHIINKIIE